MRICFRYDKNQTCIPNVAVKEKSSRPLAVNSESGIVEARSPC